MTAQQIRQAFLDYFEARGHKLLKGASLLPEDDPTTLFTGSGMQPLIPYLLGQEHPGGQRLVDSQACFRSQDIDEVGNNRHTTFFEMLGNWSLGDYFKEDQLAWFFGFLTEELKLDPKKLYVSCFIGDDHNQIPKDEVSAKIWQGLYKAKDIEAKTVELGSSNQAAKLGMQGGRIFFYDASKNWWCRADSIDSMPAGEPGGPDSEVFYEFDYVNHDPKFGKHCHPNCDCGRFLEIGNSVFMEYIKAEGGFKKLPRQNVDFGGGLERIAAAKLNSADIFKISLFEPIIREIEDRSAKSYDSHEESMRVIADHLKAAVFLGFDGVKPSNKEQGYVMRRLLRRAIRFALELGIEQDIAGSLVPVIAEVYGDYQPGLIGQAKPIEETIEREEKLFRQTLKRGLAEFNRLSGQRLSGQDIFRLYDTYGFPPELSVEEAYKQAVEVEPDWRVGYDNLMMEQRRRSQTASKGVFKGGLGGQSRQHKKYHTATHLMYQALRQVLGDQVVQKGSNITEERLRFDFSHPKKMTAEEVKQVEQIVNEQIRNDLKVSFKDYPTDYALNELHAKGQFGDKYGDKVKVYMIQADGSDKPYSVEICGGPHVEHTGQLGEGGKKFKIIKEESSSAGVRRIKAVLT